MITLGESADGGAIVLLTDQVTKKGPLVAVEMSEDAAVTLRAQLDLLIRTRRQRRGEKDRPVAIVEMAAEPSLVPDAAPAPVLTLPAGPAPALRRLPNGQVVAAVGGSLGADIDPRQAAEDRDRLELAKRQAVKTQDARRARRARMLATRAAAQAAGVDDDADAGAETEEEVAS